MKHRTLWSVLLLALLLSSQAWFASAASNAITFYDQTGTTCSGSTLGKVTLADTPCTSVTMCTSVANGATFTPPSCAAQKTCVASATDVRSYVGCRVLNSTCTQTTGYFTVTFSSSSYIATYYTDSACTIRTNNIAGQETLATTLPCFSVCTNALAQGATTCENQSSQQCYSGSSAASLLASFAVDLLL